MNFGERLKKMRQEKEMTQAELGKVIGVSARQVSYYETGRFFPRDEEMMRKLFLYFDVSADYLMGLTNAKNYKASAGILKIYNALPEPGRQEINEYVKFIQQKYRP